VAYGPDTHPTPLWNHPDYRHVGWRTTEFYDEGKATEVSDPKGARPAFRHKDVPGVFTVNHDEDGTSIHFEPDDEKKPPTLISVDRGPGEDHELNISTWGRYRPGEVKDWMIGHKAADYGPSLTRQMLRVAALHYPDSNFVGERVTGASSLNRGFLEGDRSVRWPTNRFTAEDVERYYVEAYGDDDYKISHRPPRPEHGAPLHDLTQIYPDDVYTHPHYYHGQRPASASDREATAAFMAARGNPEHPVKIYRAVPSHVTDINPGDWVTTSRSYARSHAGNKTSGFHVLEATARAGDLHTDGNSLAEYGYNGQGTIRGRPRR
jgi:hypothetical protein